MAGNIVTRNKVVDGMAKENATAIQLLHPALPQTEREIRKEIKLICWTYMAAMVEKIPQCGTAKTFFAVPTTHYR